MPNQRVSTAEFRKERTAIEELSSRLEMYDDVTLATLIYNTPRNIAPCLKATVNKCYAHMASGRTTLSILGVIRRHRGTYRDKRVYTDYIASEK